MRILVADDEALVRFGIISILEEILPGSSTILEAANGKELVESTRVSRPHIGFVDIRMPGMDGLEAIAAAKEYAPRALWVIVSGHGEFTYARRAMKLGVEDFLLKPVDPGELKDLVDRLITKAQERQCRGNRDLEAKISAVLGDTTSPRYDSWFHRTRFWQAGMVVWDSSLSDVETSRRRRNYAGRIQDSLDAGDEYSGCIVSLSGEALLVVLAIPTGGLAMDQVIETWNRRFSALRSSCADIPGEDIGDTWFLTRVEQNPTELFREIEDLGTEASLRFIHRPAGIMNYAEVSTHSGSSRYLPVAEILEGIRNTREYGNEDDFHGLTHKLNETIERLGEHGFVQGGPLWFSRYGMSLKAPYPETLKDLARRLHDESHTLFADRRIPASGENRLALADRALEVMNRRYRETIGIAQVADELGVTANYLSTVFKKEVGKGFTQKLTELRLDKAKELLRRPGANIGEVARSLGYQSSRHFTRLFKERFGVTPSQWLTGEQD